MEKQKKDRKSASKLFRILAIKKNRGAGWWLRSDTTITSSETEASLLEHNYIKI